METDYLAGYIYHMIHINNLHSILQQGAISSKERVSQQQISYRSIAYDSVQKLRDRVFVFDFVKKTFRSIHSYVPFYFATRTPMLYVQYQNGIQDKIAILEVERAILKEPGVLFTDGNASNQQLSIYSKEIVRIMPATVEQDTCRRRYYPGGPYGSNASCTNFYADVTFLDRLNWEIINGRYFTGNERKRIKQSEVLIPDSVSLKWIKGIAVSSQSMAQSVNALINRCGLSQHISSAICKQEMFF